MEYTCTAAEAVQRGVMALRMGGQYGLGSGDYHPGPYTPPLTDGDVPWTNSTDPKFPGPASDCAGFAICFAWKIVRHRPGFNKGSWSSVEDDVNVNSAMEDATHRQELFLPVVGTPKPGDLICYPTFYIKGVAHPFIGHVGLIETVPDDYKPGEGWHRLGILQCHGPDGFKPGVVRSDGSIWDHHDHVWAPITAHCTAIIRPKERT